MARPGVTYHDVAKAAEAIKAHGEEPTVDRVRERLGTGSKSTIAPLLKRWRSDNQEETDAGGLPKDLIEVVKSLHERMQQMADHRIEQAQEDIKDITDTLRQDIEEAGATIALLSKENSELEGRVEQLTNALDTKVLLLEDTRTRLIKAELQRDEANTRIFELKDTVLELKEESRNIRDHFEHYQQRTAQDRQAEREQFRASNAQLQEQLIEAKRYLEEANRRISELTEKSQLDMQHTIELERANSQLREEAGEKTLVIGRLQHERDTALANSQELQAQNKKLAERLDASERQQFVSDKELALLSQALEASKAELKVAQDRVAYLTDENKIILQEKAVVDGQFKQLQSSL
jgi:hypothetical protein